MARAHRGPIAKLAHETQEWLTVYVAERQGVLIEFESIHSENGVRPGEAIPLKPSIHSRRQFGDAKPPIQESVSLDRPPLFEQRWKRARFRHSNRGKFGCGPNGRNIRCCLDETCTGYADPVLPAPRLHPAVNRVSLLRSFCSRSWLETGGVGFERIYMQVGAFRKQT